MMKINFNARKTNNVQIIFKTISNIKLSNFGIKMFAIYKNSYLQLQCCGVDPKVINRAVDAARGNVCLDVYDINPPYNRLVTEQPCIPIQNVDVTRRPLAFGRLAIPKLRRELHSHCPEKVSCAINSFLDLLHDPEKCFEAIDCGVVNRLADLVLHEDPALRERVCMILKLIAGMYQGRMEIIKNPILMQNIITIMKDPVDAVRFKNAELLEMLARMWQSADVLLEYNIIFHLLDSIYDKPEIVVFHLRTLRLCMYAEGTKIAQEYGALDTLLDILEDDDVNAEITAEILACIRMLTSQSAGKKIAFEEKLLCKLNKLLHSSDVETQETAAAAIMFCTILTPAKWQALRVPHLPERLLELSRNYHNPGLQIYCIKALTNLVEHPAIRARMQEHYMSCFDTIPVNNDPEVEKYKKVLLQVLMWRP